MIDPEKAIAEALQTRRRDAAHIGDPEHIKALVEYASSLPAPSDAPTPSALLRVQQQANGLVEGLAMASTPKANSSDEDGPRSDVRKAAEVLRDLLQWQERHSSESWQRTMLLALELSAAVSLCVMLADPPIGLVPIDLEPQISEAAYHLLVVTYFDTARLALPKQPSTRDREWLAAIVADSLDACGRADGRKLSRRGLPVAEIRARRMARKRQEDTERHMRIGNLLDSVLAWKPSDGATATPTLARVATGQRAERGRMAAVSREARRAVRHTATEALLLIAITLVEIVLLVAAVTNQFWPRTIPGGQSDQGFDLTRPFEWTLDVGLGAGEVVTATTALLTTVAAIGIAMAVLPSLRSTSTTQRAALYAWDLTATGVARGCAVLALGIGFAYFLAPTRDGVPNWGPAAIGTLVGLLAVLLTSGLISWQEEIQLDAWRTERNLSILSRRIRWEQDSLGASDPASSRGAWRSLFLFSIVPWAAWILSILVALTIGYGPPASVQEFTGILALLVGISAYLATPVVAAIVSARMLLIDELENHPLTLRLLSWIPVVLGLTIVGLPVAESVSDLDSAAKVWTAVACAISILQVIGVWAAFRQMRYPQRLGLALRMIALRSAQTARRVQQAD